MRQRGYFPRGAALAAAVLLAALASAVYYAFVFSQFEPIRLDVVTEKLDASGHIITVTLPDLTALRGQTAVLDLQLQNTLLQPRRIGVSRNGFPAERIELPPYRTVRWDIVLPPEVIRAVDMETGDGARTLELTGDANGWALAALEVRNYYVRAGSGRLTLAVLPRGARAYTAGAAFVPVTIALCLLALLNALGPESPRRSIRRMGRGLALAALLGCVVCLLLPRLSPYKVLLSPSAFWLIAAGLFSPALLHTSSTLVVETSTRLRRSAPIAAGAIARSFAVVGRYWKRHDVTFERAAILLGLTAIAIAQPIFAVVSNSPEFFAARGTTPTTAVTAVLAISCAAPLCLIAIERAMRGISRTAAAAFHGMVVALLSAAVAMLWLGQSEILISPWDGLAGGLVGAAVALASARSSIVRQFLTALAPAALAVPALFLADPGVRQSLMASESIAAVPAIERTPPIVFVLFDELPLNSLLTTEGEIDAERYPNFAALARDAYWFRNASTVAADTHHAVPAILSGRYPTAVNDVPTLQYYPVNLFTALAPRYDISAIFRFQKLCPARACRDTSALSADTVRSLVSDLGLVWLHIALPETLKEGLPPVTDDWAEFGRSDGETATGNTADSRGGLFAQFVSAIDARPARLHFIHSMLPHMAFEYVPSGRRYRGPPQETQIDRRGRLFERASPAYADQFHQRHLAQVGFVDRLLGNLLVRLREAGVYDKALVIVTADHGASYREGRSRRDPQEGRNLSDLLRVPLLMKLPGQRHGEVVDRIVETVDVLPTILDVLGATGPLPFDGRSLVDGRTPARSARTFVWRGRYDVAARAVEDLSAERVASVERKESRFGRGDLSGLYAPPDARHLLGTNRSALRPLGDVRASIRERARFEAVDLARDPLPLYVAGVLRTARSEPLTIAVVVNGIVAAVTRSYRQGGGHMFATLIPETLLRNGANAVDAVAIDPAPPDGH